VKTYLFNLQATYEIEAENEDKAREKVGDANYCIDADVLLVEVSNA
jgi:hypothetical protein